MTVMQAWLLLGVPAAVLSMALYTSRSRLLGTAGLLVLLGATIAMVAVDRLSAAVLGVLLALLYAAGRAGGGAVSGDDPVRRPHTTAVIGGTGGYPRST